MPKKKPTKVYRYDGQSIWTSSDCGYASYSDYELGSFLGGGAAGVVYEAECFKTKRHLAVKVLNPIGYKLAPSGSLRFCEVIVKGQPYGDVGGGFGGTRGGGRGGHGGPGGGSGGGSGSGSGGGAGKMTEKHVWWLFNGSTRQTIAAYYDARTGVLKEMTLPKCIEVWGLGDDKGRRAGTRGGGRDRARRDRDKDRLKQEDRGVSRVFVGGEWLAIPSAPAKYDKFLRARASIFREISNMLQLTEHPNILRLHEALELVQDSKATIFLVLELARGGELFDRIKVDCGADEGAARHYFRQLLSGVRHCHDRGVCHRDLKPENLLLADPHDSSVLKIADFGFSALFRELETESSSGDDSSGPPTAAGGGGGVPGVAGGGGPALRRPRSGLSLGGRARGTAGAGGGARAAGGGARSGGKGRGVRRLTSVVGSPYYVAPEVLREESGDGYDGTKADVWSMGVILYAMLAGNLPFEKELLACSRFAKFGAWARMPSTTASLLAHCSGNPKDAMDMDCLDYPSWFFPQHFSFAARSLLSGLLHPDASCRLSVRQALRHPWVLDGRLYSSSGGSSSDGSDFSAGGAGGGVEEDWRAPDPQNIPSELLGADSDTEDEEEHANNGSREWKETSDMGLRHRPGYTPAVAQPPPPPPPRPVVVVATPPEKQSTSSVGRKGVGVGPAKEVPAKTKPPSTTAEVSVELWGIREEGEGPAGSSSRLGGRGSAREGQGHPDAAVAAAGGGDRQASKTTPAPRPAPPPTTAGDANPMPLTEAKEDNAGRGRKQQSLSGEGEHVASRSSGEEEKAVTPKGEGGVGGGDGKEVELETAGGGGRQVLSARRVRVATEVAVAAEAGEEGAAKEAQMAAITAVTTTPSAAAAAAAAAASLPLPPPPLAPVEMTDRFTTPPRKLRSPRPLDAFSSPPLAPVGSGRAVEEEESEFSLDAGPALPPGEGRARSREGLPPAGPGHARSRGENSSAFSLGVVERQLSMGVAGISIMEAAGQAEKREGVVAAAAAAAAPPPAFHDLVKRSTRFMTSVPAAVVLRKIATIIDADAHPLPYPYRNIKQKAVVHQDDYKLEIMRGGVLVCTVQIYLLGGEQGAAQYMVEFLRGQLDIFLFKRFYEDVRCKLNDLVKKDYSLALLESGTCTHRFSRFSNLA